MGVLIQMIQRIIEILRLTLSHRIMEIVVLLASAMLETTLLATLRTWTAFTALRTRTTLATLRARTALTLYVALRFRDKHTV